MCETVRLTGISRHGKNRVLEQGDIWRIAGFRSSINTVKHRTCSGPFVLLERGSNSRWVATSNDPDFEVEFIR